MDRPAISFQSVASSRRLHPDTGSPRPSAFRDWDADWEGTLIPRAPPAGTILFEAHFAEVLWSIGERREESWAREMAPRLEQLVVNVVGYSSEGQPTEEQRVREEEEMARMMEERVSQVREREVEGELVGVMGHMRGEEQRRLGMTVQRRWREEVEGHQQQQRHRREMEMMERIRETQRQQAIEEELQRRKDETQRQQAIEEELQRKKDEAARRKWEQYQKVAYQSEKREGAGSERCQRLLRGLGGIRMAVDGVHMNGCVATGVMFGKERP